MTQFELEILDGDRAGTVMPLPPDRLTVGRKADNHLVLNDEKVSGRHAEVVKEGDGWLVRDLGSTNGTMIDGRRIDEVALSPFDVVQFGRVRVRFQAVGAAPPEDELRVHQVDRTRLQSGGKGALLALGLLLAVGGAAVWWFFLRADAPRRRSTTRASAPLQIEGNKLNPTAASCEDASGWSLRIAGTGFSEGGEPHSGNGALEALRVDADGAPGASFAVARLAEPVPIQTGDSLVVSAFVRTEEGARIAVRARFASDPEAEGEPAVLWTGTEPAEHAEYTEVKLECACPAGMDQVDIELVALLPRDGSAALVDDVGLVRGGSAQAVRLTQAGRTLAGTGGNFTLRSTAGTVLSRIGLAATPGGLAALQQAGLDAPSDVGAEVSATAVDGAGFRLQSSSSGMALHFAPAIADGEVLVRTEDSFTSASLPYGGDAVEVLLGSGADRIGVKRSSAAGPLRVDKVDGHLTVVVPDAAVDLVVGFTAASEAARDALGQARAAQAAGQAGKALEHAERVLADLPHDSDRAREAQILRSELLEVLNRRVDQLRSQIDEAVLFRDAASLRAIERSVQELIDSYGRDRVAQVGELDEMTQKNRAALAELAVGRAEAEKKSLQGLAAMFGDSGEAKLAERVRDYLKRHFDQ